MTKRGRDKIQEYLMKEENYYLCLLFGGYMYFLKDESLLFRCYMCFLKCCFVIIKKGEIVGFVLKKTLILMMTNNLCQYF